MKKMTVGELAKLYGLNRQSIYKRINKGDLSKGSDGKIDFAEAIRVFGEPSERNKNVTTLQSTEVQKETEVDTLKLQVDMLQKQLRKAEETEEFLKEQIKTKDQSIHLLQTLLSAPKEKLTSNEEHLSEEVSKMPIQSETTNITETNSADQKHIKPKKSLLGRVFSAVFTED